MGHVAIDALRSLNTEEIAEKDIEMLICQMYGSKRTSIDEARFDAFLKMTGGSKSMDMHYHQT